MPYADQSKRNAYLAAWRERHREYLRELNRARYAANVERERERSRAKALTDRGKALMAARGARWKERNPERYAAIFREHASQRRSRKVAWADKDRIVAVYEVAVAYRSAGFDVEVDHILPLKGRTVSGLHVPENLTVLWTRENRRKSNRSGAPD